MKASLLLGLLTVVLCCAFAFAQGGPAEEEAPEAPFEVIPIPKREYGPYNFNSQVIRSQDELDAFLESVPTSGRRGGKPVKPGIVKTFEQAELDFSKSVLVLIRHTEGSGSVRIDFLEPEVKRKRLVCRIDRDEPELGDADMAEYCFALVVDRQAIEEIEINVKGIKKPVVLPVEEEQDAEDTE